MIQPCFRQRVLCFLLENGLCILHDEKDLKPTEGRWSHHTVRKDNFNPTMGIALNVMKEWLMPENEDVLLRVVNTDTS